MSGFKKFVSYYKPHMGLFIFDTFCSLLIGVINLAYPYATRAIINEFIPEKNLEMILIFSGALVIVYLIKALFNYLVATYGHKVGVLIQADMRKELFQKLQNLPVTYFDENKTGTIMSRVVNDLMDISELAHHLPEEVLLAATTIIGAFVMLSLINVNLTLIVFACVPFFVLFAILSRNGQKQAFAEMRKRTGEINADIENSISGIRVSKAYNTHEYELSKFDKANNNFVNARMKAYHYLGLFNSVMGLGTDLLYLVVLVAGGLFYYYEKIDLTDFLTYILYISMLINPIRTLVTIFEQLVNGMSGYHRFLEVINTDSEKEDSNPLELKEFKKAIRFQNVSFKYKEEKDSPYVLKKFNLNIVKGETIALVGPSGGGKTTICHLLPRFYDVTSGKILLDGKDIRKYSLKSLRDNIGIVAQDVFLFAGSIKENIAFGRLDASEEEIIEACKNANIYDFIMSLPEKFDTYVGERGVKLSGGQKQRIAIARAFLKNPEILILDEATSALDNVTEMQIQSSLEKLSKGRTTIVVAHRLSTVKNADEIIVLDEHGIIERGNHENLIAQNGIYANLYSLQFKQ